jgi:hypothetical protein
MTLDQDAPHINNIYSMRSTKYLAKLRSDEALRLPRGLFDHFSFTDIVGWIVPVVGLGRRSYLEESCWTR